MNHSFAFPLFTSRCYLSGPGTARGQEPAVTDPAARAMRQSRVETFGATNPIG